MKKIIYIITLILMISVVNGAYWVKDPASCPTTHADYPGSSCAPDDICGDFGCYDTSSLGDPGTASTYSTDYTCEDSCDGGYVLDCFSDDGTDPRCNNGGSAWCDRNSTCYGWHRYTSCTDWGTSSCTTCYSGYKECDSGNDACEVVDNDVCETHSHFDSDDACVGSYGACDCDTGYDDCDNDDGDANQETGQYGYNGCEINEYTTDYPTGANNRYDNNCACTCDTNYKDCDASGCDAGDGCDYHYNIACGTDATWISTCSTCQCDTNYYYCDGSPSDGDGCEINDGGSCSVGALSGTYDCTVSAGGCYVVSGGTQYTCTCLVDDVNYGTSGTLYSWSGSNPFLWFNVYGSTIGLNISFDDTQATFLINKTGAYWNGTDLSAGGGSSCDGETCDVTNTGTLDGYEGSELNDTALINAVNTTANINSLFTDDLTTDDNTHIQINETQFNNESGILEYNITFLNTVYTTIASLVSRVGNWTADKVNYYNITQTTALIDAVNTTANINSLFADDLTTDDNTNCSVIGDCPTIAYQTQNVTFGEINGTRLNISSIDNVEFNYLGGYHFCYDKTTGKGIMTVNTSKQSNWGACLK